MKITCESYMGTAWLLDRKGNEIEVYKHPNERIDFDSIVSIIEEYGSTSEQKLAVEYQNNPTEELKAKLMLIYNNDWCKVRTWGTFGEELIFRITSTNFNWYNNIIEFLLRHRRTNVLITVETVKNGKSKIYWDKVTYDYAVDPENQVILENKLKR